MEKATIIGIDLAKRVFQVHAASKDGRPVLRKKVSRAQLLGFLAKQPPTIVAMEACATAHEWGRAISGLGHDVRLVPPRFSQRCIGLPLSGGIRLGFLLRLHLRAAQLGHLGLGLAQ